MLITEIDTQLVKSSRKKIYFRNNIIFLAQNKKNLKLASNQFGVLSILKGVNCTTITSRIIKLTSQINLEDLQTCKNVVLYNITKALLGKNNISPY